MGAFDISRNAFNPAKHYASLRMQQGRVITDDDWNENERIENEERRRRTKDIIGPYGSPDQGFKIANIRWNTGLVNFDILPGILYLGGLRLEMDKTRDDEGGISFTTFRTQTDWLQQPPGILPTPLFPALVEPRFDLVYLEAWQQGSSAVEDNELFEAALAGPDTSTRVRYMRRVHVATDLSSSDCWRNAEELAKIWADQHLGQMTDEFERRVNTRLVVGFTEEGTGDDLCSPSIAGSYLGAENQAIRVQLVDATHFTWGFDNASPYYRIQMIDPTTVQFLDLPKDQHHWPLAGENIEILAWSALLPNGEKIAEQQGHLSKISASFDPNTQRITLSSALPANFNTAWTGRPDAGLIQNDGDSHLYLRVWQRGDDTSSAPAIPIAPGANVLGNTGLTVTFLGTDRVAGDHWVIAARPETPEEIVPWRLQHEGLAPHGFRRFFAPLAVLRWSQSGTSDVLGEVIRDCRRTFRPLTNIESCCTFHIGDGKTSFGDFNSLEEAFENLPDEGGKLCLLPGKHHANLKISERDNITICGCGEQSLLMPNPDRMGQPIIFIANSQKIKIEQLCFAAMQDRAILLADAPEHEPSSRITIQHNSVVGRHNAIHLQCQEALAGNNDFYIGYNTVAVPNLADAGVGIFCLADGVFMERNRVVLVPAEAPAPNDGPRGNDGPIDPFDPCDNNSSTNNNTRPIELYILWVFAFISNGGLSQREEQMLAPAGIQIGGSSEHVKLLENTIIGGASNGVTLGHIPTIFEVGNQDPQLAALLDQVQYQALTTGDLTVDSIDKRLGGILGRLFLNTLYDIHLEGNEISEMGLAGIGIISFFQTSESNQPLGIEVFDFQAIRNHIQSCAQQIPQETRNNMLIGYGGLVQAFLTRAVIDGNTIENCGQGNHEPICGIYIMSGEKFEISNNRILNNGPEPKLSLDGDTTTPPETRRGTRGGIFIAFAIKTDPAAILSGEIYSDGIPAAFIHDNIVVQPLGQSLFMIGMGPISVESNSFVSQDQDQRNPLSLIAGSVLILNLGVSKDLLRLAAEPTFDQLSTLAQQQNQDPQTVLLTLNLLLMVLQYLPSGQVLFNDNQVTLDLRDQSPDLTVSSVAIGTLDDLSFVSNQLECKGLSLYLPVTDNISFIPIDYVLTDALLAGFSIRTSANRFQEGFAGTFFSLVSIGLVNTTIGNQSSHCMLTYGLPGKKVFEHNIEQILPNLFNLSTETCGNNYDTIGVSNNWKKSKTTNTVEIDNNQKG